ncbi:succinate dehydrogenase, cytochrome b556 subunit [Pseudomonas sp. NPDC089530]|uniref:succinate dehydrogenase, cytochrome b556 subunit n=1 Tax=Pseudomonas sp. NPDC089530 TaxID=3390651 RepID=UPI003D076760
MKKAVNSQRPVNLDLRTIKLPVTAYTSILHRISGVILFVSLAIMLYALDKSLSSEEGFGQVKACLTSPLAKLVIWGILSALLYHLVAGVRHLIMDMGIGAESESKEELDRFCDAMIRIREEIRAVENGSLDKDDNPLKNAPHTAAEIVGEWSHPYSREQAVYPVASLIEAKYWPPVGRVDNVFGDRNLVCACPSIESYQDA